MNIGNSGFEYVVGKKGTPRETDWRGVSRYGTRYDIRNIKTKDVIFSLWYGHYISYRKQAGISTKADEKKFLGLDDRYYWIKAVGHTDVQWGQIQSSGAVIGTKRTIIKQLDFYPIYAVKASVPVIKTASVPAPLPTLKIAPKPAPKPVPKPVIKVKTIEKEEEPLKWLEKLINWIKNLLNLK